jgi:creatinine amidohydrolase
MRIAFGFLLLVVICPALVPFADAQNSPSVDAPRPIAARQSLWTEELTWMEVRDAVRAGNTRILIGTGGIEHNGPYVVTGKHNYVLQTVLPYIAREIGHTLIAPIVKFVPEGEIDPKPTDHMAYPGTISVEQTTFEVLLTDICRSYRAHGFRDIILIGDSGGNQKGMENVARQLNAKWKGEGGRVHYLPEYYSQDPWSYQFLKKLGIVQIDKTPPPGEAADRPAHTRNGLHDDIYYEAQVAVQDPNLIRAEERLKTKQFSLHGVDLAPLSKTVELGRKLAEYRAQITAAAFARSSAQH